ncbi:MAG: hypothetical protein WC612_07440 [Bdellovibrionales bacterium]|jgi:hypothetical protein
MTMVAKWLTPDEIIDLMMGVILKDHTAACPYFGRAHLYTGPRKEVHGKGTNILGYIHDNDSNHERAKFLATTFDAKLIDEMNVYTLVLNNIVGSGHNVYRYIHAAFDDQKKSEKEADDEADRVMRKASKYFVDGLWGHVTTSVCGAGRNRIFFDTEFPRLGKETVDLITGLAKSCDIETVNEGSIMDIRKLFKLNAIETAYRVVCVNEQNLLNRMAWDKASEEIMRHCLDVEEFYMIDRQKGWKAAAKELFIGGAPVPELVRLDRKLTRQDRAAKRSPKYCKSPAERLSQKESKLLHFVTAIAARTASATVAPR